MPHIMLQNGKVDRNNIGEALQQAIEIEIATLPTYLYTYYSINRTPDQAQLKNQIYTLLVSPTDKQIQVMSPTDANKLAQELSAQIMVFANKAAATVLSVAIEEMLHMSLASNVKQALVGMPKLICRSPFSWPAQLAGHEPPFDINKAGLCLDQLLTFLKIESPAPLKAKDVASNAIEYVTIGEFYQQIEDCIKKDFKSDKDYDSSRSQLVPDMGYYAPNCINTAYYDRKHQPRFMNANDSGDLIHVVDQKSALKALKTIVTQGEGYLNSNEKLIDCSGFTPADYDDPQMKELSHFAKFQLLYCQLQHMKKEFSQYLGADFDVESMFVMNVPVNPTGDDYPPDLQLLNQLTNAVYSYLFVMSEACYRASKNVQFEIFMFGIHKSMMWILGSLASDMTNYTYYGKDGKEHTAAATFEEYPFATGSTPKQQIIDLFNQVIQVLPDEKYIAQRLHDLPNVSADGEIPDMEALLLANVQP